MKKSGIIPGYIITILLLLVIGLGVLTVKFLKDSGGRLDAKLQEVKLLSGNDFEKRGQNALALKSSVPVHQIEVYSKHEVTLFILEYADYLDTKYKARISAPLVDDLRTLTAQLEFTLNFDSFEPFSAMLDELLVHRKPMVYISKLSITEEDPKRNAFRVNMEVDLSMPYVSAEDAESMRKIIMSQDNTQTMEASNEEQ